MTTKKASPFKVFSARSFKATSTAWTDDADAGLAFPAEVEQSLAWVAKHLTYVEGDSVAYGVFLSNSQVADAICEVVVTRKSMRSKWVKLLRVRLRPSVDEALNSGRDASSAGMRDALEIFVAAAMGLLNFGHKEKANTIKIYGRSSQQADFLRFLGVALEAIKSSPMRASMQGKFLVVQSAQ